MARKAARIGSEAMNTGEEILGLYRTGRLTRAILERYSMAGLHRNELDRIKAELKGIVCRCFYDMPGSLTDEELSRLKYREWFSDGGGI